MSKEKLRDEVLHIFELELSGLETIERINDQIDLYKQELEKLSDIDKLVEEFHCNHYMRGNCDEECEKCMLHAKITFEKFEEKVRGEERLKVLQEVAPFLKRVNGRKTVYTPNPDKNFSYPIDAMSDKIEEFLEKMMRNCQE